MKNVSTSVRYKTRNGLILKYIENNEFEVVNVSEYNEEMYDVGETIFYSSSKYTSNGFPAGCKGLNSDFDIVGKVEEGYCSISTHVVEFNNEYNIDRTLLIGRK